LGTSAANKAKLATGKLARLPKSGMQCSSPQNEISKRGLMMTIFAMTLFQRSMRKHKNTAAAMWR
jgi:hypothetical protein